MDSVEILDDDSCTWRPGPKFPVPMQGSASFQDPRGGLIVIVGADSSGMDGSLYRLRHAGLSANWEALVPKTKLGLHNTVAIPIPDEIVNC